MESAPTLVIFNDSVNMVWHNDKFMQLNAVVDVRIVFCHFDLPLFSIAIRLDLGCGQKPP